MGDGGAKRGKMEWPQFNSVPLAIIGGTGSSGSTMLAVQLDRHPDIACGPEVGCFNRPVLYDRYQWCARWFALCRRYGVVGLPYGEGRGFLRNLAPNGLEENSTWAAFARSHCLREFTGYLAGEILRAKRAKYWIEKTPGNVACISSILEHFAETKFIALLRNPQDVCSSLQRRGFPLEETLNRWMWTAALTRRYSEHPRVGLIKYEALVANIEHEFDEIQDFLGIEPVRLRNLPKVEDADRVRGLSSWRNDPNKVECNNDVQPPPFSEPKPLPNVRLTEEFAAMHGTPRWTLYDLCDWLGYDRPPMWEGEWVTGKRKKALRIRVWDYAVSGFTERRVFIERV